MFLPGGVPPLTEPLAIAADRDAAAAAFVSAAASSEVSALDPDRGTRSEVEAGFCCPPVATVEVEGGVRDEVDDEFDSI